MPLTNLILLRAPGIYDFRKRPILHMPQSESGIFHAAGTTFVNFLAVASRLEKAGRRARVIDLSYRMARSKRFDVESFIRKLEASVFAIELSEVVQAPGALETARLVKKHHPDSRTIFCGCAAARFHTELITYPDVDCVMRGNFNETSAAQFMQVASSGRFGKIPGLVWKEKRGRVRQNELSEEPDTASLDVTECYTSVVSQIWRYRNFDSAALLNSWLRRPEVSIFKTGCAGPSLFTRHEASREPLAFRAPEDVYRDIAEICRFSPAPVSIKGDIRASGKHDAERLLSLLQHKPVANTLIFELNDAAPAFFIQEIARASPRFQLNIAPGSHDVAIRKTLGQAYSNRDLESTIESALKARVQGVEILFLVGLPGQTAESVVETTVYCEYLLRRFDGDRRLWLSIAQYSLPSGSPIVESPGSYGFRPRFRTFAEYLEVLVLTGWKDRLAYETAEMPAEQMAAATYGALTFMARLKAKYGQIPYKKAEDMAANYAQGMEMTNNLGKIVKSDRMAELALLKPEIDRINAYNRRPRPHLPMMMARPQNLLALGKALVNNKPKRR